MMNPKKIEEQQSNTTQLKTSAASSQVIHPGLALVSSMLVLGLLVWGLKKAPEQTVSSSPANLSAGIAEDLSQFKRAGEYCRSNSECLSDFCSSTGDFSITGRSIRACKSLLSGSEKM